LKFPTGLNNAQSALPEENGCAVSQSTEIHTARHMILYEERTSD
jgi:hypothetical protein